MDTAIRPVGQRRTAFDSNNKLRGERLSPRYRKPKHGTPTILIDCETRDNSTTFTCNVLAVRSQSRNNGAGGVLLFNQRFSSQVTVFPLEKQRSNLLLTESEVSRSWARLFTGGDHTEEAFESAENLLDALRPESPLRLRLSQELEELKEIYDARVEA